MSNSCLISLERVLDIINYYQTEEEIHGRLHILNTNVAEYAKIIEVKLLYEEPTHDLKKEELPLIKHDEDSTKDDYFLYCANQEIFRKMITNFEINKQIYPYNIFVGVTRPIKLDFGELHIINFYGEVGQISKDGAKSYLYSYQEGIGIEGLLAQDN